MIEQNSNCGCRTDADYGDDVEFCNLHAAAPKMLEALQWINDFVSTAKDGGAAWVAVRDQPGAKEWATNMSAAITAATGEES